MNIRNPLVVTMAGVCVLAVVLSPPPLHSQQARADVELPPECRSELYESLSQLSIHSRDSRLDSHQALISRCNQAYEEHLSRYPRDPVRMAEREIAPLDGLINFENPHVHPLDLTPDGGTLLAVNTAAHRLEVYEVEGASLTHRQSITVGIDPISVRARSNDEAWVVNHVSDSVSIVELTTGRVVHTLDTDNEPADVVFAGSPPRAFVSASEANKINVFDLSDLTAAPQTVNVFGEDPRSLAVSPDGQIVYAGIFESGNNTTLVGIADPLDGGGTIVRGNTLADNDVAVINANSLAIQYQSGLMNIVMALAVNPVSGNVSVVGTEAFNEVTLEPNLNGVFAHVNVASFAANGGNVQIDDLNPHLNYNTSTVAQSVRNQSIGDPRGIAWRSSGNEAFVTGMGSNNVVVIDSQSNRVDRMEVGQGPTGIVLNDSTGVGFVMNKFDGTVSVIDLNAREELERVAFDDPTLAVIKAGRPMLYDTHATSGLGHVSCGTCHLDGKTDRLAWDLGNPSAPDVILPVASLDSRGEVTGELTGDFVAVPGIKGPMTTQSLQDIMHHPLLHWRGDKANLGEFNPAFTGLLGDDEEISDAQMEAFGDFLDTIWFPPNPYRFIDDTRPNTVTLPDGSTVTSPTMQALRGDNARDNHCLSCHSGQGEFTRNDGVNDEIGSLVVASGFPGFYERLGKGFGTAGFGYFHNGGASAIEASFDNEEFLAEVLSIGGPSGPLEGAEQRQVPHAGMGKQVTISGPATGVQQEFVDELQRISDDSPFAQLVAHTHFDGVPRGFVHVGGANFQSDVASGQFTVGQLLASAAGGDPVTFTLVAEGMENRFAIDADLDGIFNGDEVELSNPGDQLNAVGDGVSLAVQALDPTGQSLSYSATLPQSLGINAATGLISGTLVDPGVYAALVTVQNTSGGSSSVAFTWFVTDANGNLPPVLTNPGARFSLLGDAVTLGIDALDYDGNSLLYSATDLPPGLSIDPGAGVISGTTVAPGTYEVTVVVNDGNGGVANIAFNWVVSPNLLEEGFQSGAGAFSYIDDAFRATAQPNFADGDIAVGGGVSGDALRVTLGGTNNQPINNISGGWRTDIQLFETATVDVSFSYNLSMANQYANADVSQVLLSIDDTLLSASVDDFIAELASGGSTGWQQVTVSALLDAGNHSLVIGAYNNFKNQFVEVTTLLIDDVTVSLANRAPALVSPDDQTSIAGSSVSLALQASDADNDPITFVVSGLPPGLEVESGTGVISGVPDELGDYTVNVTVSDPTGASNALSFRWFVTDASGNLPPTLVNPGDLISILGDSVATALQAVDLNGDALSYSAQGLPPGLSLANDGAITGIADTPGVFEVSATVSDGRGALDTVSFTWTVTTQVLQANFDSGTDDFDYVDDLFRSTGQPDFAAGDVLIGGGVSGDALEVLLGGVASGAVNNMSGGWETTFGLSSAAIVNITFSYNLTLTTQYEPTDFGQVLISVDGVLLSDSASDFVAQQDDGGSTGWQSVTVSVALSSGAHTLAIGGYNNAKNGVNEVTTILLDDVLVSLANRAPELVSPGEQSSIAGQSIALVIEANDADNDPLSFVAAGLPPQLSIDPSTGIITGTPDTLGIYDVIVTVNDGNDTDDTVAFTWFITDATGNLPPVLNAPGTQVSILGDSVLLALSGSDPNGDSLNFMASGLPSGLSMAGDGVITGITDTVGEYIVSASVSDGRGASDNATFTWEVTQNIIDTGFDSGTSTFTYVDDVFRGTAQPDFASGTVLSDGGVSGDALQILLGGVAIGAVNDMSGGWVTDFSLPVAATVNVTFSYNLTLAAQYEPTEFGQVLISIDGVLLSTTANDYIVQQNDGGSTQWQTVTVSAGLSSGAHTLAIGGYNNVKNGVNEVTTILLDDVLVSLANRAPTLVPPGDQSTVQSAPVTLILQGSDADNDVLAYTASGLPTGLTLDAQNGQIDGTSSVQGVYQVEAAVSDSSGASASVAFTWLITDANGNLPPVLSNPLDQVGVRNESISLSLQASDPNGDNLSYSASGLPPGLGIDDAGLISGTLNSQGTYDVTVTVTDGSGATDTVQFIWTVSVTFIEIDFEDGAGTFAYVDDAFRNTNQPNYADGALVLGGGLSGDGLQVTLGGLNFLPVTGMSGGWQSQFELASQATVDISFAYSMEMASQYINSETAEVLVSVDGNLISDNTEDYVVQLAGGGSTGWQQVALSVDLDAGVHTLLLGGYNSSKNTITKITSITLDDVRVQLANRDPVLSNPGQQSNVVGAALALELTATDADNDLLSFSASDLPSGLTIDASTGAIGGNPDTIGVFEVTVLVDDGNGGNSSVAFNWLITDASGNLPPLLVNPGSQATAQGEQASLQLQASDPNGDTLSYSAVGLPVGLTLTASSGLISGTPTAEGSALVTVTVSDGNGGSDSVQFTWDTNVTLDSALSQRLDSSQAAFEEAPAGQWVSVGRAEYESLLAAMAGVTAFGTDTTNLFSGSSGDFGGAATYTFGQVTNPSPASVHVFAFRRPTVNPSDGGDDLVRLSPNLNGSQFHSLGGALPDGRIEGNEEFFVLKGADQTLFPSPQYLGLTSNDTAGTWYNADDTAGRYLGGNTNSLVGGTSLFGWSMQALAIDPTDIAPVPAPIRLIDAHFEDGTDGFEYEDDAFLNTSQPDYASGQLEQDGGGSGMVLGMDTGGINSEVIFDMSAAWKRDFSLSIAATIELSVRYNLTLAQGHEPDELVQFLASINNTMLGHDGQDYVVQLVGDGNGGVDDTTGWQTYLATISLPAGTHTLTLGSYHNKKSTQEETAKLRIDDVVVSLIGAELFRDDFEIPSDWVVNASGADTATVGQWEVASPQETTTTGATVLQRGDSTSGLRSLVTGATAGNGVGSFDVDGGVTSVTSPDIDLPSGACTLSLNYYLAHLANATGDDWLRIAISDGTTEQTLLLDNASPSLRAGVWTPLALDISQFAGRTVNLVIEVNDGAASSTVEGGIDDVVITADNPAN